MSPKRRSPGTCSTGASPSSDLLSDNRLTGHSTGSRAVSWWAVHEFVAPILERTGAWPMVGTPEWCSLPVDHPARIAALFDAARHWALRVETAQQARAEAAKDVAQAEDWGAVAQRIRNGRGPAYVPRRGVA